MPVWLEAAMAQLLSSASIWKTGSRSMAICMPSSLALPARRACETPLLEVCLPYRPSLRSGSSSAPVHFMGGGPRTYPGGVTKWQWKRMQLKKTRQIEKARLMREKHIYEARRRAELIAASPVLEMPWQKMSRVRPPNYISSNEQITKLAARFHKQGAEDLWTEKDGPEKFEVMDDDGHDQQPSPRFPRTRMHNQDIGPLESPPVGNFDEQWDPARDGPPSHFESFRHMPRIRPGSTPYPEPYPEPYRGRSRRPYR